MSKEMQSKCINCGFPFKEGDKLQAFLCSPNNPEGSWTKPVIIDADFQTRVKQNQSNVKRRHVDCGG